MARFEGRDKGAMSTWKKIAIGAGVVILLLAIAGFGVYQSRKNVVTVQTGKAQHQDLASVVSASGEIKPKTYVNIGANAFGKITKLYVKEGDRVKKGQLLAQLEKMQVAKLLDKYFPTHGNWQGLSLGTVADFDILIGTHLTV